MDHRDVQSLLESLAEPSYRDFSLKLLPGVEHMLGVRIPTLRKLARQICRGDWRAFLWEAQQDPLFEMVMLCGMAIAHAPCSWEERTALLAGFVPRIDNWSVCDVLCGDLKVFRDFPEEGIAFLEPFLKSTTPFAQRFGLVMLMMHFLDAVHVPLILHYCTTIRSEHYYVRMAIAWVLSMVYVVFPEAVLPVIESPALDDTTHRMTLQKLRESQQVSDADKQMLLSLKRK